MIGASCCIRFVVVVVGLHFKSLLNFVDLIVYFSSFVEIGCCSRVFIVVAVDSAMIMETWRERGGGGRGGTMLSVELRIPCLLRFSTGGWFINKGCYLRRLPVFVTPSPAGQEVFGG